METGKKKTPMTMALFFDVRIMLHMSMSIRMRGMIYKDTFSSRSSKLGSSSRKQIKLAVELGALLSQQWVVTPLTEGVVNKLG